LRHKRTDADIKTKGGTHYAKNRVYPMRGLLVAKHKAERTAARISGTPRQICPYAAGIFERTQPDPVQSITFVRAAIPSPAGDRRSGAKQINGDSRPRNSARSYTCRVGLRLTETPPLLSLLVTALPLLNNAPTARERSLLNPFYNTNIKNSIPKGADLCKAIYAI